MNTANESVAADLESLVAEVADRFTDEVKQGRSPSVEEYAQRHPANRPSSFGRFFRPSRSSTIFPRLGCRTR